MVVYHNIQCHDEFRNKFITTQLITLTLFSCGTNALSADISTSLVTLNCGHANLSFCFLTYFRYFKMTGHHNIPVSILLLSTLQTRLCIDVHEGSSVVIHTNSRLPYGFRGDWWDTACFGVLILWLVHTTPATLADLQTKFPTSRHTIIEKVYK